MTSFLLASINGATTWIAMETEDGQLYSYVPNTGRFHANRGLTHDRYIDQEGNYLEISPERARELVDAGDIGRIDGRRNRDLLARYQADPESVDPATILPPSPHPSAASRAALLEQAPEGEWVTWQTYPRLQKQRAHVAANDIRTGRIRALESIGPIEVRVRPLEADTYVVEVRRHPR